MTCDAFEVAVVPFPFTDSGQHVKRPATAVSRCAFNREGHSAMAMITDARNPPWPLDVRIDHLFYTSQPGFSFQGIGQRQ